MRKPLSASQEAVTDAVSGVLAYRCGNGHIFMVLDHEKSLEKRAGQ